LSIPSLDLIFLWNNFSISKGKKRSSFFLCLRTHLSSTTSTFSIYEKNGMSGQKEPSVQSEKKQLIAEAKTKVIGASREKKGLLILFFFGSRKGGKKLTREIKNATAVKNLHQEIEKIHL
jgi:hypothetical protein